MWRRLNSSSACLSSSPGGSSACSRSVSTAQRGALVGVELSIRLASPAGFVNAYSSASIPPHDEPNRWIAVEPEPVADAPHLLDEGLDRPERRVVGPRGLPLPSWSKSTTRRSRGQRRERLERQSAAARPAVQAEQRQPARLLAVAEDAVGRLPSRGTGGRRSADRPGVAGVQQLAEVALALLLARACELFVHQSVVDRALDVAEDADRRRAVRRVREPRQRVRQARSSRACSSCTSSSSSAVAVDDLGRAVGPHAARRARPPRRSGSAPVLRAGSGSPSGRARRRRRRRCRRCSSGRSRRRPRPGGRARARSVSVRCARSVSIERATKVASAPSASATGLNG